MDRLVGAVYRMFHTRGRADGDFVDRLNHRLTVYILIVFSILVTAKQWGGDPIVCWCPAEFTDNHLNFAMKSCWVQNTYYVPDNEKYIPTEFEGRVHLGYYQWVPLILLMQGLLFYWPVMYWRVSSSRSGLEIHSVVEAARNLQRGCYHQDREVVLRCMTSHIDRYLTTARPLTPGFTARLATALSRVLLVKGRRHGNALSADYVITKFLQVLNAAGQFLLLSVVLGGQYYLYGIDVLHRLLFTNDWQNSPQFPRVTLCDFDVRKMNNIHRHTVQCVLQINMFNEKIYAFLWFWLIFIGLISAVSLAIWLYHSLSPASRVRFVTHHLRAAMRRLTKQELEFVPSFSEEYLHQDGVWLLRTIAANGSTLVVAELTHQLWLLRRTRLGLHAPNLPPGIPMPDNPGPTTHIV